MHKYVCFNQRIIPAHDAGLSVFSSAALYGKGVFTTININDSKPFLWDKHWARIRRDAETIGVDLSNVSKSVIKNALTKLIERNDVKNGRARLTFYDEAASAIWSRETNKTTSFMILTANQSARARSMRLTISPFSINSSSPLAGVKSCNYLENILAFGNAKSEDFDEAVRLNERGEIVSACMANVFWTRNDEIYTPPAAAGCLPGTTREFIIENFKIREKSAAAAELIEADDVFLTSSGIGIVRASVLGKKLYGESSNAFLKISEFFDSALRNNNESED